MPRGIGHLRLRGRGRHEGEGVLHPPRLGAKNAPPRATNGRVGSGGSEERRMYGSSLILGGREMKVSGDVGVDRGSKDVSGVVHVK